LYGVYCRFSVHPLSVHPLLIVFWVVDGKCTNTPRPPASCGVCVLPLKNPKDEQERVDRERVDRESAVNAVQPITPLW
jgi:hypothetical protein